MLTRLYCATGHRCHRCGEELKRDFTLKGELMMEVIKKSLTFGEYVRFVNGVVDVLFTKNDDDTIEYNPDLYDSAFKLAFAKAYCGYEDVDKDFDVAYSEYGNINPNEIVANNKINIAQYEAACCAIREKIEFNKQIAIQSYKKDSLADLASTINTFVANMDERFKDVDLSGIQNLSVLSDKVNGMSEAKLVKEIVKSVSSTKGKK